MIGVNHPLSPPYPAGQEIPDEDCAPLARRILADRQLTFRFSQTSTHGPGSENGQTLHKLVLISAT